MNSLAAVIAFALKELLLYAPDLFVKFQKLFQKKDVSVEDLENLKSEIESDTYSKLVPNSKIPPS